MQGNTATVAFGASAWTANIHMIGGTEQERPDVEDSHLGTVDKQTFVPGDLYNAGEFELEFEFDPDSPPPISGAAETITLTFPTPAGKSAGATLAGTGYLKKWKSGDMRNNTLAVGTGTIKWDGKTGPAWTDSAV